MTNSNQSISQFEQAMQMLQNIVQQLEAGKLTLAEAMKLYRQGMELAKDCQKTLSDCQLEVEIIQKNQFKENPNVDKNADG